MAEFVKIASWHIPSGIVSRGGMVHTFCGKWAKKDAATSDDLPTNEKTCESCFRNREIARQ